MKALISLLIPLLLASGLCAQPLLRATADKDRILIGEPLELTVELEIAPGDPAPPFAFDSVAHFERLGGGVRDSVLRGDRLLLRQVFTLTSWDSGRWSIPPFAYGRLRTRPIAVSVDYLPLDPEKPYNEIKDIRELPPPPRTTWHWYLVGLALLLLLLALFFPRGKRGAASGTPADPYRTALEGFERLRGRTDGAALAEGSALFRAYLQGRLRLVSASRTSGDLAVQLAGRNLPQYGALVQAMRLTDAVKFARYTPTPSEVEEGVLLFRHSVVTLENKT